MSIQVQEAACDSLFSLTYNNRRFQSKLYDLNDNKTKLFKGTCKVEWHINKCMVRLIFDNKKQIIINAEDFIKDWATNPNKWQFDRG